MADWDASDLVQRCKRLARRPAVDESTPDADWNAILTEAQIYWMPQFAAHAPQSNYFGPVKLTTGDAGLTYDFPDNNGDGAADWPLAVELRISPTGRPLFPGPEWDQGADFVVQGAKIRFPGQKKKTFPDGPWARYVPMPASIDSVGPPVKEPILQPAQARILLVYRAVALWARRGGLRDPQPYEEAEYRIAWGDPTRPGDIGILGALKHQYFLQGSEALPMAGGEWWRFISDGSGYVPIV